MYSGWKLSNNAHQAEPGECGGEDIKYTNCAMSSNGIETNNAFKDSYDKSKVTDLYVEKFGEPKLIHAYGNNAPGEPSKEAISNIGKNFENVAVSDSKIGDIVTYSLSPERAKTGLLFQSLPVTKEGVAHFSVVALKSSDGQSVQTVLEKDGSSNVQLNSYSSNPDRYTPKQIPRSPANNVNTQGSPIYRKK